MSDTPDIELVDALLWAWVHGTVTEINEARSALIAEMERLRHEAWLFKASAPARQYE